MFRMGMGLTQPSIGLDEQGMYDPVHVPAEKMTADILTKWLPLNDFAKHRAKLTNRRAQSKMLELK